MKVEVVLAATRRQSLVGPVLSDYKRLHMAKSVVLAGKPLDAKLVARITKERTLADLTSDLAEIGYGT